MRSPDKKLLDAMAKHLLKDAHSAQQLAARLGIPIRKCHRYLHALRESGWDVVRREKSYLILRSLQTAKKVEKRAD